MHAASSIQLLCIDKRMNLHGKRNRPTIDILIDFKRRTLPASLRF
jgi:hypothetical protein